MSVQTGVLVAGIVVTIAMLLGLAARIRNNGIADTIAKSVHNFRGIFAERGTEGLLQAIRETDWISHYHDARNENASSKRVHFRVPALPEFAFYILDSGPAVGPIFVVRGEGVFRGFEASAGLTRPSPKGTADAHEAFGNNPTKRAKGLAAAFQRRHGWTPNEVFKGWRNGVYVGR